MKKKREFYIGGYPIKDYLPIFFLFSIFGAIGNIVTAIGEHNDWARLSLFYLGICLSLYFYSNESEKEERKREIARLNQEIRKLESFRDADENIIKLLKQENERLEKHQE